MNLNSKITLGIHNFFKKHSKTILIIGVTWLAIIIINSYLKTKPKETEIVKTYNPDNPIVDDNGSVPQRYRNTIKETINKYFDNCNSKQYESAYKMLTAECKSFLYESNIENFKQYVDEVFNEKKIYNIQNYSNFGDVYIYDIHILNDIESTGTTDGYNDYIEKLIVTKEDNQFKISNQGYIGNKQLNISAEDDSMKVTVNSRDMSYQKESYNIEIKNKTDKYIIIANNEYNNEVTLEMGNESRKATNISNSTLVLAPNETKEFVFIFNKFYDDKLESLEIDFNIIRLVEKYNASGTNVPIEQYSFNVSLEK